MIPEIEDTLHNGSLITAAVPPDLMFLHTETIIDGKASYSGLVLDILFEIVRGTNIRFIKADGYTSPNGVLTLVKRGEADMAIGDISLTYERSLGVNFLFPFMERTYNFMLKQRKGHFDSDYLETFANPLHAYVWFAAMATVFALYFLWGTSKIKLRFATGSLHWKKVLDDLFTYSHVFLRQSHPILQSSVGFCGCLLVLSFFLSFMVTNSYMANIVAVSTVKKERVIDTFEELSLNRRYQVMSYNNTAGLELVKSSKNEVFRDIYRYQIATSDQNFIELDFPDEEIIKRLEKERVAFLSTSDIVDRFIVKTCGMVISKDDWIKMPVGFAISRNFPHEEFFNRRIVSLRDSGVIQHLYNKYKNNFLLKEAVHCEAPTKVIVTMKDTFTIFLLLSVGICAAFLVLLTEIFTASKKHPESSEISPDNIMEVATEDK